MDKVPSLDVLVRREEEKEREPSQQLSKGLATAAKETRSEITRAFEHGSRKKLLGRIKVAEDA